MRVLSRCRCMMIAALAAGCGSAANRPHDAGSGSAQGSGGLFADPEASAQALVAQGRQIFRFDTFGDEAFWGGKLRLQDAVATLSPRQAIQLGLKVDADALTADERAAVAAGKGLDDPAVTAQLLQQNAVLGITGFFDNSGHLSSIGIQCALCHSTVDNSVAPGVGRRLDGLANRDLDVGAIIASAPNLQPIVSLLSIVHPGVTDADVRAVLRSWGPGKFDAELLLDGKTQTPSGGPAATLIPDASGLAGYNLHTWTGGWGSIPYWNAMVAVIEMQGVGTFFDERFDDATQFPIAAKAGLGHITVDPDHDRVTPALGALQVYQLALLAPKPRPGVDFDPDAAARGDALFSGKAGCNSCHHEPLWTEPGWNQHTAAEMKIDSFEADRSPGHAYKTMNLAGLFVRERGLFMFPQDAGRFYHDGRFRTLADVVDSYDQRFALGLTAGEKADLVEYLKSL